MLELIGVIEMNIAIISDIHGNIEALKKTIEDIEQKGVDRYIILGDLVAQGPYPEEVLNLVNNLNTIGIVCGNHDYYLAYKIFDNPNEKILGKSVKDDKLAELIQNEKWCMKEIGDVGMKFLRKLPKYFTYWLKDTKLCFCHASPWDYEVAPRVGCFDIIKKIEEEVNSTIYFSGHTHIPHLIKSEKITFVNPGSVGLPFDGDIRASYCIISDERPDKPMFYKVKYDVGNVIHALNKRKVPLGTLTIRRLKTGRI